MSKNLFIIINWGLTAASFYYLFLNSEQRDGLISALIFALFSLIMITFTPNTYLPIKNKFNILYLLLIPFILFSGKIAYYSDILAFLIVTSQTLIVAVTIAIAQMFLSKEQAVSLFLTFGIIGYIALCILPSLFVIFFNRCDNVNDINIFGVLYRIYIIIISISFLFSFFAKIIIKKIKRFRET